jgi:class 3 adenylate cyclase/tetratricopeptide (TPR) repeat protein
LAYKPAPIELQSAQISPELLRLSEQLARNAHEHWAKLRMSEGWRLGTERNDARKEHPSLVPFEELSEEEKNYDRQTVFGTIEALLEMGYTIQPPAEQKELPVDEPATASQPVPIDLLSLPAAGPQAHAALQKLWHDHDADSWSNAPEKYRALAKRILQIGEPLFAYDVAAEGVNKFPKHIELRQLLALALARSGAAGPANDLLSRLYREGLRDEETVGLLARTHKDLAAEATSDDVARDHLQQARKLYSEAYQTSGGYWSGVNAATMSLLLGDQQQAMSLASKVAEQCRELLRAAPTLSKQERYWILSTLGETALLQCRFSEAEDWYSQALELGRGDWGSLNSTRHNARLLARNLQCGVDLVERLFRFPNVVVFTGHRVDQLDRLVPRFPSQMEAVVKQEIQKRLDQLNAHFGYASAANGSDILFLEAMLDRDAEIHVVLPFERDQFMREVMETVDGNKWAARCARVLSEAVEVQEASKRSQMCGKVSYEFGNLMLQGLASVHAQQLETKLKPLAVWDGKPGDGLGGTAATVEQWQKAGLQMEIIDLASLCAECLPEASSHQALAPAPSEESSSSSSTEFVAEIRGLLFADVEGFSRLSDEEVPRFVEHFLGLGASLMAETANRPLVTNTWGDGLYLVFPGVQEAGMFALELRDRVAATDWASKGLPKLNLRIGLHAGPVYSCTDPMTARRTYIGAHVSRAARIEPITPAGQVYASQPFAALAAAKPVRDFTCTYVGQTSMAKKYGVLPTYVVLRRHKGNTLLPAFDS